MNKQELLRSLPSVDQLLKTQEVMAWLASNPRAIVVKALRKALEEARGRILQGKEVSTRTEDVLLLALSHLERLKRPSLRKVINATGVVIHTNLGRAPLSTSSLINVLEVARGYSNLEFNLKEGKRGKRYDHVRGILHELTGAEDALVVNNNAAAVLLCLSALARDREVVVSRGELVEIGGAFRIPDVMRQSGAVLREVGTTNKTRLSDYRKALNEQTGLLLKVHQSNFKIMGFTEETPLEDLVALGREAGIPVMFDLGSGCLFDLRSYGIKEEPVVSEVLKTGVDIVTFSGDKLLGGPQAGIILGKKELVETISRHPLTRAVRIDKMTLAALEATLFEYSDMEWARQNIPVIRMLTVEPDELKRKAKKLKKALTGISDALIVDLKEDVSEVGGGALPTLRLPTYVVALKHCQISPNRLERMLREAEPPVVARIKEDRVLLDVRTIPVDDYSKIGSIIKRLFS